VAGREHKVAEAGEEEDLLHSLVVSYPGVQPLLGEEARVLFLTQIARRVHETLSVFSFESVIDSCGFVHFSLWRLILFGLFELTFLQLLVLVNDLLLLLIDLHLLPFDSFIALVLSPRTHVLSGGRIVVLESLLLQLFAVRLSAHWVAALNVSLLINASHRIGIDHFGRVCRVDGMTEVLEVVVLLVELGWVQVHLLHNAIEPFWLGRNLVYLRFDLSLFSQLEI
jgi:hypothetical protein